MTCSDSDSEALYLAHSPLKNKHLQVYTQINITSYRIGPWAGRLPLRLISVAVMEATQDGTIGVT